MSKVTQVLKNPTKEDLVFKFDSEEYLIEAGAEELMYQEVAIMGARRLADREWANPLEKDGKNKMIASFLGRIVDNRLKKGQTSMKQEMEKEVAEIKEKEANEPVKAEEFEELNELEYLAKGSAPTSNEKPKTVTRVKNAVIGKGKRLKNSKDSKKGDK